ncbi:MAG: molybdate ABC transporter permease subunit, partial [Xanthobacteraceae bacterium]
MLDLSAAEWTALKLSLRIAVVATAWAVPFAVLIGWLLARKNFWGKTILDGLVHLPLVLPPVVTGYLLLIEFGRKGPIGGFLHDYFGIVFAFRWTGAALAAAVMG